MSNDAFDASDLAKMDVLERLEKIEANLKSADPMLPVHLKNILKQLHTYEELVHLLKDEQITVLMEGMKKYRSIELVKEVMEKKSRKAASKTTVDDL